MPPEGPVRTQRDTYEVSATGGGSENHITYTVNAGACSVTDHGDGSLTVLFISAGRCFLNFHEAVTSIPLTAWTGAIDMCLVHLCGDRRLRKKPETRLTVGWTRPLDAVAGGGTSKRSRDGVCKFAK